MRVEAPSLAANAGRNAAAGPGRRKRWKPARDALWEFLEPRLTDGARIAILGAGNGDDLPLRRIARRAGAVVLIDIDPRAGGGARRKVGRRDRRKVEVVEHDATEGAADRIVLATLDGDPLPTTSSRAPVPLPGAPYDLVVGDLLYSQLLFPALLDLEVPEARRSAALAEHGPGVTRALVARLHASAPRVVHVHDPLAWWEGHEQPVSLAAILALASAVGPRAALDLAARGLGPTEADPRAALADLGLSPAATALWRWPFAPGVDYLAWATLAST